MRDRMRGRGKGLAVGAIGLALVLSGQAYADNLSITPPPLKSVNSDKSLWSATGIYVGFDSPLDGQLTGVGGSYEHSLTDRSALMFNAVALNGSFDFNQSGFSSETDFNSVMVSGGYKWTIRPSRVYADDGTVVDAQIGAAVYGSASYMKARIETKSTVCFFGCSTKTIDNDFDDLFLIAGIMADIPLGRRFSFRPNLSLPTLSGSDPIFGADLVLLGGLEDSWELSLALLLQKAQDSDSNVYTFTYSRKIAR